jgi:hypothetical protein
LESKGYICNNVSVLRIRSVIGRLSLFAFILLAVLGSTPRVYLHELLANHVDDTSCSDRRTDGPCMHTKGFSCKIFDLVVNDSYLVPSQFHPEYPAQHFEIRYIEACTALRLQDVFTAAGRGPPAHA